MNFKDLLASLMSNIKLSFGDPENEIETLLYGKSEKHQDMRDALAEAEIPNSTKKSVILVLNKSEFVSNNASSAIMRSFSSDYEAIFVLLEGSVQYHDEFKAFQTRRASSGFSDRVSILIYHNYKSYHNSN